MCVGLFVFDSHENKCFRFINENSWHFVSFSLFRVDRMGLPSVDCDRETVEKHTKVVIVIVDSETIYCEVTDDAMTNGR